MVHSDFIAVHWSVSANASLSQQLHALRIFVRITQVATQKTSVDRRQLMQHDVSPNEPLFVGYLLLCDPLQQKVP